MARCLDTIVGNSPKQTPFHLFLDAALPPPLRGEVARWLIHGGCAATKRPLSLHYSLLPSLTLVVAKSTSKTAPFSNRNAIRQFTETRTEQ